MAERCAGVGTFLGGVLGVVAWVMALLDTEGVSVPAAWFMLGITMLALGGAGYAIGWVIGRAAALVAGRK